MANDIVYKIADTSEDFEQGKILFKEYAMSLGFDLSFQNFEHELSIINEQYNKPAGGLLLAFNDAAVIGCTGVRKLEGDIAELKRMYVQDGYRGLHIGVHLLERSLELAIDLGYKKIRLDTLDYMTRAQDLYRAFGFYEIPAYRFNPFDGAVYMEKELLS